MNEFQVSFDNNQYKSKPSRATLMDIRDRIANRINAVKQDNVKSFIKLVGSDGRAFCPATFKVSFYDVGINKNNFSQMQLFVLGLGDYKSYSMSPLIIVSILILMN